jgi:hypothetical protein
MGFLQMVKSSHGTLTANLMKGYFFGFMDEESIKVLIWTMCFSYQLFLFSVHSDLAGLSSTVVQLLFNCCSTVVLLFNCCIVSSPSIGGFATNQLPLLAQYVASFVGCISGMLVSTCSLVPP